MKLINIQLIIIVIIILISIILKLYPEIVLKVPNYGFILYHIINNAPIPPYIVNEQWKDDYKWLKSNDIIISVGIKSGTTWMMSTLHAIRTRGSVDYDSILDVVPWVDFVRYPGETLEERIKFFNRSQSKYEYALYKSHSSPQDIKIRNDVKYIIGVRNLIDVCASLKTFLNDHTIEFSTLWGGFPAKLKTDEDYYHFLLVDKGDKIGFIYTLTDYIKYWWPYRNYSNILFVHYNDRLNYPVKDINILTKFMNITLNEEEKKLILYQSSFEYMKKNNFKFAYCQSTDINNIQQLYNKLPKSICAIEIDKFVAKGKDRNGNIELPQNIIEQINIICLKELGEEICNWLKNGGNIQLH